MADPTDDDRTVELDPELTALLAKGLAQPRADFREAYLAQCEDVVQLKKALQKLIDHMKANEDDECQRDVHPDLRPYSDAEKLLHDIDERRTKELGLLPK